MQCRDDGVGLAAPQVGVNVRLMVFNPDGSYRPGNESILVNPEIVEQLGGKELSEEGCLSFPRINGDVEVGERGVDRRSCLGSDYCLMHCMQSSEPHAAFLCSYQLVGRGQPADVSSPRGCSGGFMGGWVPRRAAEVSPGT